MRVFGLTVALLLAACAGESGGTTEPVRTNRVELPKSYRFEPAAIVIDAGTAVTWTNEDDFPHNVHLLDGTDRTLDLPLGATGRLTFEEPGTIDYECSLHPQQMQGVILVR
jgi:plastocyanin